MDAPEYDKSKGNAEIYVQGSWNKVADEIVPPYEESDYGYGLYAIRFDPALPEGYDPDELGYPYLFDHWETEGPAFDMEETTTDEHGREMEIYDFDSSVRLTAVYKNNTDFVSVEFHSKNMTEDSTESEVGTMIFEVGTDFEYSIDFVAFNPFAWSLSIGDHIISFNSSRKLIKWVVTGGVTVDDETAEITTLHVTGAGYVCACFLPAIVFDANIHPTYTPILTVEDKDYYTLPQKFTLEDYPDGVDFEWADGITYEGNDYDWMSCSGLNTDRAGTTEAGRSGQVFATYGRVTPKSFSIRNEHMET
jgi:hypothetical protein